MSYVDASTLKGNLDPNIPFVTTTLVFGLAVLTVNTKDMFHGFAKEFRIVNQDSVNNLSYRQGAIDAPLKVVPPNSEVVVNGWESFIQITPNAGTGAGFIELDLVDLSVALK